MVNVTPASLVAELEEAKHLALRSGDAKAFHQGNAVIGQIVGYSQPDLTAAEAKRLSEIEGEACLYRHFDKAGALLYVGISLSALQRTMQHRDKAPWYREIVRIEIEWFDCRSLAEKAERKAIRTEHPKYNIIHNARRAA